MNLKEIRTKAVDISGRFDLANTTADYADNGMDYYIRAGQRYLDRSYSGKRAEGRHVKLLDVDGRLVLIPYARVIKEVWIIEDEKRFRLDKKSWPWLRAAYSATLNVIESGTPKYFTPQNVQGILEHDQAQANLASAQMQDYDVLSKQGYEYDAVSIWPPTDSKVTVEVVGLYYSAPMVEDTATCYWAEVHPEILVNATLRAIEITHRNTQGVNDWTEAIRADMSGILDDDLAEEIEDINQMEG